MSQLEYEQSPAVKYPRSRSSMDSWELRSDYSLEGLWWSSFRRRGLLGGCRAWGEEVDSQGLSPWCSCLLPRPSLPVLLLPPKGSSHLGVSSLVTVLARVTVLSSSGHPAKSGVDTRPNLLSPRSEPKSWDVVPYTRAFGGL